MVSTLEKSGFKKDKTKEQKEKTTYCIQLSTLLFLSMEYFDVSIISQNFPKHKYLNEKSRKKHIVMHENDVARFPAFQASHCISGGKA